jgi:hypothetical protein
LEQQRNAFFYQGIYKALDGLFISQKPSNSAKSLRPAIEFLGIEPFYAV